MTEEIKTNINNLKMHLKQYENTNYKSIQNKTINKFTFTKNQKPWNKINQKIRNQ